jgi:hypothetical protein
MKTAEHDRELAANLATRTAWALVQHVGGRATYVENYEPIRDALRSVIFAELGRARAFAENRPLLENVIELNRRQTVRES